MEKENVDYSQPFPWWSGSHNRPHQPQWLQTTTLSDLENKTKTMVNIIENDGDTFAERAEMFYKRRQEIIEIVRDLHKSYRALAEKYEQLRSEDLQVSQMKSSSFPSNNNNNNNTKQFDELLHECQSNPDTLDPCFGIDALNKIEADIKFVGNISNGGLQKVISAVDLKGNDVGDGELQLHVAERERKWSEWRLKIAKLIEENMGQQAELIKRNGEKREIIKQLRSQVNILMDEKRALKRFLPSHYNNCEEEEEEEEMKAVQSNASKLKGMGKFLD